MFNKNNNPLFSNNNLSPSHQLSILIHLQTQIQHCNKIRNNLTPSLLIPRLLLLTNKIIILIHLAIAPILLRLHLIPLPTPLSSKHKLLINLKTLHLNLQNNLIRLHHPCCLLLKHNLIHFLSLPKTRITLVPKMYGIIHQLISSHSRINMQDLTIFYDISYYKLRQNHYYDCFVFF